MEKVLFVNSCMRDDSRTLILTKAYLSDLSEKESVNIEEVNLRAENLKPVSFPESIERSEKAFNNVTDDKLTKYAKQFCDAEFIVFAAPYWDLSFPSLLKIYIENISVCGITFAYDECGNTVKLCKAKKIIYITSSGGYIGKNNFGFDYISGISRSLFNIEKAEFYSAEGLDIVGNDEEKILNETKEKIKMGFDLKCKTH